MAGWSLASYDNSTTNPQDDGKKDLPPFSHSLSIIRELLRVMGKYQHPDEWQSKLNVNLSLEAAANHPSGGLVVWAPERVEKIAAFNRLRELPRMEFKKKIPGRIRILNSLACHGIDVVVDGDALPHLQSLKLNHGEVRLSGAFPRLQTFSFKGSIWRLPWLVDAPLLESLRCNSVYSAKHLSLRPQLLPRLSYLQIQLWEENPVHCPALLVDENSLGLSHVKHVVFGKGVAEALDFNQCQVHNVSHLELAVDASQLPACWENTEWQCETLTINLYGFTRELGISAIKMPSPLPHVKKLTVISNHCPVLLDSEMLELTECTVPSHRSLGPNLKCPKLKCIRFTEDLSASDKKKCLDRATHEAIGAHPKWVYFDFNGKAYSLL